jgi:phage terminase small subunit
MIDHRKQIFIDQYMLDLNGTQAILRAGFAASRQSAAQMAWGYFQDPDVEAEIDRRLSEKRAQSKLTSDTVLEWLSQMAEVQISDILAEDGSLRPFAEWPPRARRSVQSLEIEENPITGVQRVKPKFVDKKAVIELIGKHLKMFTDKLEVDAKVQQAVSFTINGFKEE